MHHDGPIDDHPTWDHGSLGSQIAGRRRDVHTIAGFDASPLALDTMPTAEKALVVVR